MSQFKSIKRALITPETPLKRKIFLKQIMWTAAKPAKPAHCFLIVSRPDEDTAAKLRVPLDAAPTWLDGENRALFRQSKQLNQ
ncbi:hypothetical protein [Paraburkholderia sediminicola]|uniref:hypothetical protein n=1 Tax=Paraburkholderia sediminicola TaxID=458836 RepID=UPI001583382D|nr:hypothetical protein [Paraburkholderia sediminicola]